ncbi:MAG TPA: DMT family transporter [Prolixibacteraceae bacterium]|nr:DMT family transporter [Prolixibacteraceae bacterium]
MEKQHPGKLYAAALGAMICFSLSFVWFKIANISYGPLTIVFFRLLASSLILWIVNRLTGRLVMPVKKDFRYLLLLAFFEPFLYFMGESYGLQYISPTVASVIIGTIPLFAPLAGFLFFREKISPRNLLGILLSFLGVILVIYEFGVGLTASPVGVLLQFSAVFSAIGYTVVLHKISARMNNLSIILFQNILGSLYFAPFWLAFEYRGFVQTPFDPKAMLAIGELAVFASTLAFIFFTYSVRHMGITRSNMFVNFIPVFTALFAWLILGDPLSAQKILGIVVVITGLFFAQMKFRKSYEGPDPIPRT